MDHASLGGKAVRFCFYLLLTIVPLILTPFNYELFEYNKMMMTYAVAAIVLGLWVARMIARGKFFIRRTPLDIPIALFVASQFISSWFSMDPHVSWFGYYSRFNGGMWSIFAYVILYYGFVSNVFDKGELIAIRDAKKNAAELWTQTSRRIPNILKGGIVAAVLVALYGVAERLGIDKHLWVQDVQSRVFSTLGQPNWLAAYLVALIPVTMTFLLPDKKTAERNAKAILRFGIALATSILFFAVLLFTRSRSGFFGFILADGIFWGLLILKYPWKQKLLVPFLALHLVLAGIVFVNGSNVEQLDKYISLAGWQSRLAPKSAPAPAEASPSATPPPSDTALTTGGTESTVIRKYVWEGALTAWRSSTKTMLIGTGTETFAFAFFRYKPQAHNMTSEWDFLYNKAHNEYLNFLATTGIIGLATYSLMLLVVIGWFIVTQVIPPLAEGEKNDPGHAAIISALFAGYISILFTNFFGFSVVVMQILFFLFPAMMFVLAKRPDEEKTGARFTTVSLPASATVKSLGYLAVVGIAGTILILLGFWWYADKLYATAYRFGRFNRYSEAEPLLVEATDINPAEPLYHDELSVDLATLAVAALDQKDATTAAELARESLHQSDLAITTSPNNVNFWKSRTKIFYAFSNYDPQYNKLAIEALEQAGKLSPMDPKISYNLAVLYGRQGENDKAIKVLRDGLVLKPNYRDLYNALYVFYTTTAPDPAAARAVLTDYLTKVDPNDADFKDKLTKLE